MFSLTIATIVLFAVSSISRANDTRINSVSIIIMTLFSILVYIMKSIATTLSLKLTLNVSMLHTQQTMMVVLVSGIKLSI
ncbi:unnamed protein product [Rotaria magnacalcarata]